MDKVKRKIMLVDDNLTNLNVGKNALLEHYDVLPATSAEKMFKLLGRVTPDLILLDVEMPVMGGYEAIKILKSKMETAFIPVIFLTAMNDQESELAGLSLGAVDYITKPFVQPLLLKRIELHLQLEDYNHNLKNMVDEKTRTILEMQNAVFELLAEVVEYKDDVTGGHVSRTQKYLRIMLEELVRKGVYTEEVSSWDNRLIVLSSQLHDVGKVAIKDSLLLKEGRLTPEEFEEMKKHTVYGAKIIEKIESSTSERRFIEHARLMALTHHEKWDGTGYPYGLKGQAISLEGRLMAFADVYDALVSTRPYKAPFTHLQAVDIIRQGSGTHFDPALVEVFLGVTGQFLEIRRDEPRR
ncbi:MAG: response regulator [Deltaproteobacteria bacterium]|jgi:putative two-component system response regulator|nr:response regulator [Deltaproteobacteria bacterium]